MTAIATWTQTTHNEAGELTATLADGRVAAVWTQYGVVQPYQGHQETGCRQLTTGGRCTCPANADIMAMRDNLVEEGRRVGWPTVMADHAAREAQRRSLVVARANIPRGDGWCDRCSSYCYGDCQANG